MWGGQHARLSCSARAYYHAAREHRDRHRETVTELTSRPPTPISFAMRSCTWIPPHNTQSRHMRLVCLDTFRVTLGFGCRTKRRACGSHQPAPRRGGRGCRASELERAAPCTTYRIVADTVQLEVAAVWVVTAHLCEGRPAPTHAHHIISIRLAPPPAAIFLRLPRLPPPCASWSRSCC